MTAPTTLVLNKNVVSPRQTLDVTIYGTGGSLSDFIDTRGFTLTEIIIPSGWTTAAITFLKSADNSTYYSYSDEAGTEASVASVAASSARRVKPEWMQGSDFIQLRSGTVSQVVSQTTDKTITLVFRAAGL